MPQTGKLILYLDSDSILPIVITGGGEAREFLDRRYPDGKIPLYFRSTGDTVTCDTQCRADWLAGTPGTLGDFWTRIVHGQGGGNAVPDAAHMVAVLQRAGVLNDLTRFYCDMTGSEVNIPVAYLFADAISLDARKCFLSLMAAYGNWQLVCYNASATLLMAHKGCLSGLPGYGQKVLTAQLSGDVLTFNAFGTLNNRLARVGHARVSGMDSDPVRRTLAELVIDTIEDKEHQLRNDNEREREIAYQMRHVDDWLQRENGSSFVVPFSYRGSTKNYPVTVAASKLKNARDERIRRLVAAIDSFRREHAPDDALWQLVLLDDTLGDPEVCRRIERQINGGNAPVNRVLHLNGRERLAALSDFNRLYASLEERLDDFDRNAFLLERRDNDNAALMANAEVISALHRDMSDLHDAMMPRCDAVDRQTDESLSRVTDLLRESRFDEAQQATAPLEQSLQGMADLEERFASLVNRINSSGQDVRRLIDQAAQTGDNPLVNRLNALRAQVRRAIEHIGEQRERLAATQDVIAHYRECYPRFSRLLERLHAAGSTADKKAIWQQIEQQRLTLEPCPIIELDRPIEARLRARVDTVKEGGFLGFGGKKTHTLHVELTITDPRPVPFASLLIVQDAPLVTLNRHTAHVEQLPERFAGSRSWQWTLPLPELDHARECYIYYKPVESLDQNTLVRCDYVKLQLP